MDTDFLFALLSSRLPPDNSYADEDLLLAIADANGDVELAFKSLTTSVPRDSSEAGSSRARKRKWAGMDDWISASREKKASKVEEPIGNESVPSGSRGGCVAKIPSPTTPTKKPVPLMSVLQSPSPAKPKLPRKPPLTLATPSMISQYTPTTYHPHVLPPELACKLYYALLEETKKWEKIKWWINDRLVESTHTSSFYARKNSDDWIEAAQFWYNGRPAPSPKDFPPEMEEACQYVEKIVNQQMTERDRYPLEWQGEQSQWKANVAASNCYRGAKEAVGFHADQLTNLGPCPSIASISLGTSRIFRLREVIPTNDKETRQAQTFNIPLAHNSLLIMHPPTQEYFKHSVPSVGSMDVFRPPFPDARGEISPHNERINITFRFFRPDFTPSLIPRCPCGVPTILRSDMKRRFSQSKGKEKEGQAEADGSDMNYFWQCNAGARTEQKGCSFFKLLDMKSEGRGQFFVETK